MNSVIHIDTHSIYVPAETRKYSVSYRIENPSPTGYVEAVNPDGWINSFSYESTDDSTGVISFNVDEHTGTDDRETTVTVIHSNAKEPVSFSVKQANPSKVFASELENTSWKATFCRFDREMTIFNEVNPEIQSE